MEIGWASSILRLNSSRSRRRATVKRRTSPNSSSLGIESHSLFRRTSVRLGSSIVNACSEKVRALASISSWVKTAAAPLSARSGLRSAPCSPR